MTPERFRAIVQAYGADAHRWPDAERGAAQAWAAAHAVECAALLADADELDGWLAAIADDAEARWARDATSPGRRDLFERIVAGAPVRTLRRRARLWWSTAAFAGVGVAGAFAGAFAMSLFLMAPPGLAVHTHETAQEAPWLTTSFGSPIYEGSEE
jgi:hypothetical protein